MTYCFSSLWPNRCLGGKIVNWNHVYYFSQVASCGSFRAAAEKLGISPSTVSEQVSQLEAELKAPLFHRQNRKVSLTEGGSRLYAHVKEMFEGSQRLLDVVSPLSLGGYRISVGIVPGAAVHTAYSVIADYIDQFGPMDMHLSHCNQEELEESIAQAKYDFGFSSQLPLRKDILAHEVASSYVKFYVSAEWLKKDFSELIQKLPLLVCGPSDKSSILLEELKQQYDFEPRAIISSDYPGALVELCQRGLGIGVLSDEPVQKLNKQALKSLRAPAGSPKILGHFYALWIPAADNTRAVRRLKQQLGNTSVGASQSPSSEVQI